MEMTAAFDGKSWRRDALRRAPLLALVLLLGALAAVLPGTASADRRSATQIDVVGSGTLIWKQVVVRSRPNAAAPRVAVLGAVSPQLPPAVRARAVAAPGREGRSELVPRERARPAQRTHRLGAGGIARVRPVEERLIVRRGARRFEFWDGDRLVRAGKVAVGKPGAETPLGLFYVTWKFNPRIDPEWAILGSYAFETSAYSKLTDWPGGGIVGLHGTPWPSLLGQAVSHGCVRMSNANVEFLRARVPLGTPVAIVR